MWSSLLTFTVELNQTQLLQRTQYQHAYARHCSGVYVSVDALHGDVTDFL